MPRTLALIDDDEAVRDSLSALLAASRYGVESYESASAFLAAHPDTTFDGIILDHQMEGLTGIELLELLNNARPSPVIVLISGNLTDSLRTRALRAGASAILEKPFSDEALLEAIETSFSTCQTD